MFGAQNVTQNQRTIEQDQRVTRETVQRKISNQEKQKDRALEKSF